VPGPRLTDTQKAAIQLRRSALIDVNGIVNSMRDFLTFIEHKAMDETGKNYNPWLYVDDSNLSKAIDIWNYLKGELITKVNNLP